MSWIIPTKKINSDFNKPLDILIKEKSLEALLNAPKLVTELTTTYLMAVPPNQYFSILGLTGGGTIDKIYIERSFYAGADYSLMYQPNIFIDGYKIPVSTARSTLEGWSESGTGFVHLTPYNSSLKWRTSNTSENFQTNSSHNLNLNFSKSFQLDMVAPSAEMASIGVFIMYSLYN